MFGQNLFLQWSILQDMICKRTAWTADPLLDSWFAILFSFASQQNGSQCSVAFISSIVSGLPSWSKQEIIMLMPTFFNDLYCFNYWHLLDFIYFPLNINSDHWILMRVGIKTNFVEIFDSLGEEFEQECQQVGNQSHLKWSIKLIDLLECL